MSRQMSLFKGRQAQGQEWLAFLRKNDEIKRNAAFEGLTFDDIYVLVLMAQTSDNALLERFQRLPKTDRGSGQMLPQPLPQPVRLPQPQLQQAKVLLWF